MGQTEIEGSRMVTESIIQQAEKTTVQFLRVDIKGAVCLLFLKTVLCSQKQGQHRKKEKHIWLSVCLFFFFLKNIKKHKKH